MKKIKVNKLKLWSSTCGTLQILGFLLIILYDYIINPNHSDMNSLKSITLWPLSIKIIIAVSGLAGFINHKILIKKLKLVTGFFDYLFYNASAVAGIAMTLLILYSLIYF